MLSKLPPRPGKLFINCYQKCFLKLQEGRQFVIKMESKEPYKDLNYALRKLRSQIMEGVPYAQENCPQFNTPKQAFNWLQRRTLYKKDPKGVELFQTLPTLLDENYHGITGAGDCDCFTIGILTLLVANGLYKDCGIVLAGRNKFIPVHIYAYTTDEDGQEIILDLTNKIYDLERFYPYIQKIPLIINQNEERQMFLQLAEDFLSGKGKTVRKANQAAKAQTKIAKKTGKQESKQLKKDLKFQSKAGSLTTAYDTNLPEISPDVDANYTYLPNSDMHVRNDYYDEMESSEFQNQMLEEGVSPHKILELSGARAARKMVKSKGKANAKVAKKSIKAGGKASARQTKAQGKVDRKQYNTENRERISGADKGALFNKLTDIGGSVISKYTGATPPGADPSAPAASYNTAPEDSTVGNIQSSIMDFFNKIPTPVKVIGGLAIIGGIAYKMKKK